MSASVHTPKPDFIAAMNQFRAIALASADALLTEGNVHPDHKLLDLCASALHHLSHAQKAYNARDIEAGYFSDGSEAQKAAVRAENARLYAEYRAGQAQGKPSLHAIRTIKATTAAGIYAKAMVVRASRTGAKLLAMSLAEDLIACPGLRESLWPAQKEDRP
jgi:hypothetical protein